MEDTLHNLNQFKIIPCVQGYKESLKAYGGWSNKIMSLSRFRQTRFAYIIKFGESAVGDKYHQLRFLNRCIKQAATRTFDFGPNVDFDEGDKVTRSCFCCV